MAKDEEESLLICSDAVAQLMFREWEVILCLKAFLTSKDFK